MIPLKVALLEDNKDFLKELMDNLKRTELVTIVVAEQHSENFIKKVREQQPDALFLDIHLKDESISGIEVAAILKLPVLFLSGVRTEKDYLSRIDELKTANTFPVDHHGKIPDTDKLKALLKTFIPRVRDYQKKHKVKVKPKGEEEILILTSDVSFIETIKATGNHKLYFFARKPIETADTTFEHFRNIGFSEETFYKLGKSHLFNIATAEYENGCLLANFKDEKGENEQFKLLVPEDKRKEVKKLFLK